MNTTDEINEADIGYEQRDNYPPDGRPVRADDPIAKGDLLAYYNRSLDMWHVKRVVKASRLDRYLRDREVNQTLKVVAHDATPIEGMAGNAHSHYGRNSGFREVSTRMIIGDQYGRDDSDPWYHVVDSVESWEWIRLQDRLWAEYNDDHAAEEAAQAGTPKAFEARMEARAQQIDAEANRLEHQAEAMRQLAEAIRHETRGRWIK
jgi:hypothetical protein